MLGVTLARVTGLASLVFCCVLCCWPAALPLGYFSLGWAEGPIKLCVWIVEKGLSFPSSLQLATINKQISKYFIFIFTLEFLQFLRHIKNRI